MGQTISFDKNVVIKINYKLFDYKKSKNIYNVNELKTIKNIYKKDIDKFVKSQKFKKILNDVFNYSDFNLKFIVNNIDTTLKNISITGYFRKIKKFVNNNKKISINEFKSWTIESFHKILWSGNPIKINKNVIIGWKPNDVSVKYGSSLSKNSKKIRPSPSESATLFPIGKKKKGNNGNMWIVNKTKNGVKRWKKL